MMWLRPLGSGSGGLFFASWQPVPAVITLSRSVLLRAGRATSPSDPLDVIASGGVLCAPAHIFGSRLGRRSFALKEMRHGLVLETLVRLHGFHGCPDHSDGASQLHRLRGAGPTCPGDCRPQMEPFSPGTKRPWPLTSTTRRWPRSLS